MKNNTRTDDAYLEFYQQSWAGAYSFWHKIINRGKKQVAFLTEALSAFSKSKLKILDLGCGEGDEIAKAIKNLKNKEVEIFANDTSLEALARYQENNQESFRRAILGRLENVPDRLKLDKEFDLILFSHCLYGVNTQGLFEKFIPMLKDGGQLLIFLDSQECALAKIRAKFRETVGNMAEEVMDGLFEAGIFFEGSFFSYDIDLEKLKFIDPNGINNLLIPFSMRKNDLSEEIKKEIAVFIDSLNVDEKISGNAAIITIRRDENESRF
jgi:SAM-dependent methyltransferase